MDHVGLIGPFRRRLNSLRAVYPNGIPGHTDWSVGTALAAGE